jgi:hypothetical protein
MMSVSRLLGHALHSQSLFARKPFLCVRWEKFSLRSRGAYCRLFLIFVGTSTVIFPVPSRRETHVLFFREKSSRVSRRPIFIAFRAKSFRLHGPSRLFFFSVRAGHLARRGGRARRSFWA